MFGSLYELGPQRVVDASGTPTLEDAPWAWNRRHMALLFIDQPIGTGFSLRGHRDLPSDEATVAADLYVALQELWHLEALEGRPLFIAGESYAGVLAMRAQCIGCFHCGALDTTKTHRKVCSVHWYASKNSCNGWG